MLTKDKIKNEEINEKDKTVENIIDTEENEKELEPGSYLSPEQIEEIEKNAAKKAVEEFMEIQKEEKETKQKQTSKKLAASIKGFNYNSVMKKVENGKDLTKEETLGLMRSNALLADENAKFNLEQQKKDAIAEGLELLKNENGDFLLLDENGKPLFNTNCMPAEILENAKEAAKLYKKAQVKSIAEHEQKWGKPQGTPVGTTKISLKDKYLAAKKAKDGAMIAECLVEAQKTGVHIV